MNLFRSEEHARRWSQFEPRSEQGFISLAELAGFFGTESRRHMLDGDYLVVVSAPRRGAPRLSRADRQDLAVLDGNSGPARILMR